MSQGLVMYTLFCINCDDVWQEAETTKLGARAKARQARGFIDAMPVQAGECAHCQSADSAAEAETHGDEY